MLLDVGCGSRPFAYLLDRQVTHYLGTDLSASPSIEDRPPDAFARAEALPFKTGSLDTVLGISMLNYLAEPIRMLEESHRVLRPGGVLILEFPQHPLRYDLPDRSLFSRSDAEQMLARTGFVPFQVIPIGGPMARMGLAAIARLNDLNRGR